MVLVFAHLISAPQRGAVQSNSPLRQHLKFVSLLSCSVGSQVVIFGSFETNVYTPTGDLDLSIVLPESGVVRYQREEVEISKGLVSKTQRVKILRIVKKLFLLTRGELTMSQNRKEKQIAVVVFPAERIVREVQRL
jgi:predicted nucleotidyltransferase